MRKKSLAGALAALLLMIVAAAASAQEVTQAEKDRALQYLESTKKNVLEATKGLSEAQWNFKPAPDRWSVAQVMEHIAHRHLLEHQPHQPQIRQKDEPHRDRKPNEVHALDDGKRIPGLRNRRADG